jgi:hypothetical protein
MKSRFLPVALTVLLACVLTVFASAQEKKKRNAAGRIDLESEMPADAHKLQLGDAAPNFTLPGIDGKTYSLDDFREAPVLMACFAQRGWPSRLA